MHREVRPSWYLWSLALSWVMVLVAHGMLLAQAQAPNAQGGGNAIVQPLVEDTEWEGVQAELTTIERTSGDMLTIKFKYINHGSKEADISQLGQFSHDNVAAHIYYVDAKSKKKYLIVKDAEGKELGTNLTYFKLAPNGSKSGWAKFPAPPADVPKVSVYLPGAPPFEDVPIR